MSETDELRRMLSERGVEWEAFDDFEQTTQWSTHYGAFVYWARERDGKLLVETTAPTKCSASCTPEQAIAATLGRGECHDEGDPSDFCCSECGVRMFTDTSDTYTMIASDGRTIIEHPNYCPNCGRRIVGPTTNDVDVEVDA